MTDDTGLPATVSAEAFVAEAIARIERVAATQGDAVQAAARLLHECVRDGGVVQAFGTGHSQALAMEIAGRAGGLIPTNMISLRDVVLFGDAPAADLRDGKVERGSDIAERILTLAPVGPKDVFVIASNSGINGSIVEFAQLVRKNGHPIIAITSLEHSDQVESRHPSGAKLKDLADVVLDNAAPFGDAVLPLPDGGAVCGVSSITAALLAQMIVAEVVRAQLAAGEELMVYLSANIPGGDTHNDALEARYAGRIRRGA